ncbi:hypothetical protein V1L54_05760 [Streptomyces sp. TRM 70361]|uniref:hypothetical protein n=1 Tax=Streptomyces sp. TRM 70361 TaxID=3116553 RepID=UPI002E7B3FB0|nr:hypothetical protein [Streptomyces sp. TRM 70361]MEE1938923.1 hypothetical protein [Streptomyces sp. TRM 70361]
MRTVKSRHAGHPDTESHDEPHEESTEAYESYEIFRVVCPDCAQPIALLADEETLPEHALCPTPWNPFGLTVCRGSGRSVADAGPDGSADEARGRDAAMLLTLPEGLDWRTQPFSHAGGPGTHPMRVQRGRHARH